MISSFTRFWARNAGFAPRARQKVAISQGWTEPWTFRVGAPWVGPLGPTGLPGGSGSRGPTVARLGLRVARFGSFFCPFWPVFCRAVGLDRVARLGQRGGARVGPLRVA